MLVSLGMFFVLLLFLVGFAFVALFMWLAVTGSIKSTTASTAADASAASTASQVSATNITIYGNSSSGNITYTTKVEGNPDPSIKPKVIVTLASPPQNFKAIVSGNTVNGNITNITYKVTNYTSNTFTFEQNSAPINGDVHVVTYIVA